MDVEKDGFCKPDSSERKLRFKKNNKKSIDNKDHLSNNSNNKTNTSDTACTSQSSCDDDSILDFKSPKRIRSMQSKVINSNKLPDKAKKKKFHSKPKIIINEKKSKNRKPLQNKKIFHDIQQSLIESSFFKSEKKERESPQSLVDVKTAFVCPLCFKNFKNENSQAVHMKSCATKNNVSTKKLIDAVELQERQAAERKSLGLLSAPILQDKQKSAPRKIASCDDPDLQLALALSKSLYEKEEMEEWDEVQIVAIASNPSVSDNNAECPQKATLQNFGFSSSRNMLPTNNWPINKTKKRRPIEPTILQRRTTIERERILTERIAEILMGCKDFTQRSQEKKEEFNDAKEKIIIKSQLLQQLRQIENTLWNRTKLILTQDVFYVKQLSSQITPLEKKEQKNEEQNVINLMELNVNDERSSNNEQMQEIQIIKTTDNNKTLINCISSNAINMCCKEKQFLDDLATSWRNILNDSSASDIIVFVKNSRYIWTHKLVFYTRCTNILLDVVSNDTEFSNAKEKICWLDTDYDVALAFLEFVYCGVIDKYSKILDSQTILSGIRALGRKYKINNLFAYLHQKRSKSNVTEVKHNYNINEESIKNVHSNIETAFNVSKLDKSFNKSSNCMYDFMKNISCAEETQKDVNDLHHLENNYVPVKNLCVLQDENNTLIKLSDEMNFRSNTPAKWETSASPDMFDETVEHSDKSTVHLKDSEDSNIHVLLSLIKQDADIDFYSQKVSTVKTQNTEHSELDKNVAICSKNLEQSVIKIDPDFKSNSQFSIDDMHNDKDFIIDTPQSSKSQYNQDNLSKIIKQKSNLTLFIEEIQKENAKLDAEINAAEMECSVQISPTKYKNPLQKNPFRIDKSDNSDLQFYDNNIDQPVDTEKKPGRLTIIEQYIQSYASKNPEFYSHLSNEYVEKNVKQINSSHINSLSSEKITDSSHNNVLNCTQNFTSSDDKNVSEQVISVSKVCSQHTETMNQSLSETIFDLETNEEEISMYSKYMRDHKDNSIVKYRSAINRNKSDNNLSNKSTSSDSSNEDSNISEAEKDEILNQSVLTQKDTNVNISDTESISSVVSHIVLENEDFNCENISYSFSQSRKEIESNQQDIINENNSQLFEVEKFSKTMTYLEEEKDINSTTESNSDKLNTTETSITQKYKLSELNDDQKKECISSPIMVSSSPDFLNSESCSPTLNMESLLQDKQCHTVNISELDAYKLRKPTNFTLDFEDDIYLANVDIDKYEKQHVLEKSQSFNTLNMKEFKNGSSRSNNKSNHENIKDTTANDYENLNSNKTSLTQKCTGIKKFKRKSLSEGQIDTNRLYNQGTTSMQFQCNYNRNIENIKTPKITDKDVTPPPVYNDMSTPELNKKMKKYGLKVQKRSRAVKLLTHIYNELHPLVSEETIGQQITEISSDEDEPPLKKRNVDDNNLEKLSDAKDSDNELPYSQDSNNSVSSAKETTNKEMEFYETESSVVENASNITEAFIKLINIDKDLHNKILQYEPVNIDQLRSMLQTYGFKCKFSDLMSFLDQQCITFYVPEQSIKSRTRRKS